MSVKRKIVSVAASGAILTALAGCCTGRGEVNSPLVSNPDAKKMNFISIVRFTPEDVPGMVAEAKRAAEATGMKKIAYSMGILPSGKEPLAVVKHYAEAFGQLRRQLEGSGIEAGILVQSLVGHGWPGAGKVDEGMEFAVNQKNQTVYRQCMMDANFRKYSYDAMVLLSQQKPAFFLMDDDLRTINNSSNGVECFCASHMKYYEKVLPQKFASAADLIKHLENSPADDPVVAAFEAERRKLLLGFAQMIRDAIDSVDSSIRCGYCSGGGEYLLMGDVARILAGKHESFLRINNGNYLERETQTFNFVMYHCAFKSRAAGNVDYILDESDTCPHNRYSKSAISMHAHIAGSILNGSSGAKLWITNLRNDLKTSTAGYERILKKHRQFYDALLAEMPHVTWLGPVTPLIDVRKNFNPARARAGFYNWKDFQVDILNRKGIPGRYEFVSGDAVYLLTGGVVDCLSDAELRTALSSKAVVDGYGAKKIAARGFAAYLGCNPIAKPYRSSGEWLTFAKPYYMRFQNNFTLPYFSELAPGVEILGECRLKDKSTGKSEFVAPGTIFYRNPAGGKVVTRAVAVGFNRYNDYGEEVKMMMLEIFRRLDDKLIPFYIGEEQPVYFRCVKHDQGGYLLGIVNLCFDSMENIDLRTKEAVKSVEILAGDGCYRPLKFRRTAEGLVIDKNVLCYETVILRIK